MGKKVALPFGGHAVDGHANASDGNVKILMRLWAVASTLWAGFSDQLQLNQLIGRELADV